MTPVWAALLAFNRSVAAGAEGAPFAVGLVVVPAEARAGGALGPS